MNRAPVLASVQGKGVCFHQTPHAIKPLPRCGRRRIPTRHSRRRVQFQTRTCRTSGTCIDIGIARRRLTQRIPWLDDAGQCWCFSISLALGTPSNR